MLCVTAVEMLAIQDPVHVHDLPTGAPRWDQKVVGYEYTILSGQITFQNGIHTGALPGALVRGRGTVGVRTGPLPDPPEWATNAHRVSTWPTNLGANGSTADTALQASLESEAGISNQSRIA